MREKESVMLEEWLNTLKMLRAQVIGDTTDKFLELLLKGMDFAFTMDSAFWLFRGYQQNIKDFSGRYVFNTRDGSVAASAVFKGGDMMVHDEALDHWDVKITFANAEALRHLLFSRNPDVVRSLLHNEIEIDGNQNYIYKFVFMTRDLAHRLGVT